VDISAASGADSCSPLAIGGVEVSPLLQQQIASMLTSGKAEPATFAQCPVPGSRENESAVRTAAAAARWRHSGWRESA
jgi:hypothetical protein